VQPANQRGGDGCWELRTRVRAHLGIRTALIGGDLQVGAVTEHEAEALVLVKVANVQPVLLVLDGVL